MAFLQPAQDGSSGLRPSRIHTSNRVEAAGARGVAAWELPRALVEAREVEAHLPQ